MNKYLLLLCLFLSAPLWSINQMPLIATMTGEFNGANLGYSMCSIDFNGDGVKDLVALEENWNHNGVLDYSNRLGRINFYWGGSGFDNQADYTIEGTYNRQYGLGRLLNAGDVNDDGIEDLCYWGTEQNSYKFCIFYGRQVPQSAPDFSQSFPSSQYQELGSLEPLGDVNNDGHADIGYVLVSWNRDPAQVMFFSGADLSSTLLMNSLWGAQPTTVYGVGDVNHDGIADYVSSEALSATDNTQTRLTLHFGSNDFPTHNTLVLSANTNNLILWEACPLGDVNGDGIDDFCTYNDGDTAKIWYGSENLTPQWNATLPAIMSFNMVEPSVMHGDLNHDGHQDVVSSYYRYAFDDGIGYMWLGSSNLDSNLDLVFPHPTGLTGIGTKFGYSKAVGDFNNDGCDDIAYSQPWADADHERTPGKIFVYAGNTQLTANEDNTIPAPTSEYEVSVYPNPLIQGKSRLNINFTGKGYIKLPQVEVKIFNLKGQKIYAYKVAQNKLSKGCWSTNIKHVAAGDYVLVLYSNNAVLQSKKITFNNGG